MKPRSKLKPFELKKNFIQAQPRQRCSDELASERARWRVKTATSQQNWYFQGCEGRGDIQARDDNVDAPFA